MRRTILLLLALGLMMGGCTASKKEDAGTKLSFRSFDGGGPQYSVRVDDPTLVSAAQTKRYAKKDHKVLEGAGYEVIFTFTGLKAGTTVLTVEERSPIAGNYDHIYEVTVDENLQVTLRELTVEDLNEAVTPMAVLVIETADRLFYAAFEDNSSAAALRDRLNDGPIAVELHDYGRFEKVGDLPWGLETNDEEITTEPGDVILCQGDQLSLCYDRSTRSLTRLARINNVTGEELREALGKGDVTVLLYLEWSE